MLKKLIFIIFTISIYLRGFAQTGGESVYQFLNVPTSARQVALGGEVLTIVDDVSQPIWNPAAINEKIDNQFGANYLSYLAGIKMGSVAFAHLVNRQFGTLHASVQYLDYGELIEAEEDGTITGTFKAHDLSFSVGYAYRFKGSGFYLGGNVKYISSTIASYSSSGLAADIALMFNREDNVFRAALVARNIGAQIEPFIDTREDLPFKIAFGASWQPEHVPIRWHLTFDNLQQWDLSHSNPTNATQSIGGDVIPEKISFLQNSLRHVVIGAELFPEGFFSFRIGYNFKRAKELELQNARTFPGISLGFGLKLGTLKFSYAYSKLHHTEKTSTFSLLIKFNN